MPHRPEGPPGPEETSPGSLLPEGGKIAPYLLGLGLPEEIYERLEILGKEKNLTVAELLEETINWRFGRGHQLKDVINRRLQQGHQPSSSAEAIETDSLQ